MEMDKINKLKQKVEEYLAKEYCCEFKKECKDGVRVRCSAYEVKLYLILRFEVHRENRIEELETRCTELFLQNNEFAERFEKSIEIIKKLLSCCRNYPQENAEKVKQAEQFLRETDIDNAIQKANEGLNLDKIAEEVKQDIKEQKVK